MPGANFAPRASDIDAHCAAGFPRILFVCNEVLGWKSYGAHLAAALAERDDIASFVLRRRPPRVLGSLTRCHFDTTAKRLMRPFDSISAHQGIMGHDIRAAIAETRPGVVHLAGHWPAGALLEMRNRPAFTVALDATRANELPPVRRAGWHEADIAREGALFRQAAHLFPMSHYAGNSLIEDFGIVPDHITVSPPSIPAEDWPQPSALNGTPAQILFVGNDLARKGAKRLLDWVDGPLKGRCHLHVVSTDALDGLEGSNLTFHGRIPHNSLMTEIFPKMDIFCLPTAFDMSPHVLAEAAAAGLPSVTSRICGIPEMVIDGETGFVLPPEDDRAFVHALDRLVSDVGLRQAMGWKARKLAETSFVGEVNHRRLIDILKKVAQDHKVST